MQPDDFLTHSLRAYPRGAAVTRILTAAMRAVDPTQLRYPKLDEALNQGDGEILVLGVGKAAPAMCATLGASLAERPHRGLLIPKRAPVHAPAGFEVIPGGHPVPNTDSLRAGQRALELAGGLKENDLLVCLVSGGGSALMTAPLPGLELDDLQALTRSLLACGARVDEINLLRRHLDQVKGGGLAKAAFPARVISYILSDVVGNPLEAIASGPTAPDPGTKAEALGVLAKYDLMGKVPAAILRALENAPETPKPGDGLFARVENFIVGSNALAAQAALHQAQAEGFHPEFLGDAWQGEAREVAKALCARLKSGKPKPFCMVAGGETTVSIRGDGLGGRNQELALAAVAELAGLEGVLLVALATDGEDGPTDAAGAVTSGESLQRARTLGLDPDDFLHRNDSYRFFAALGDNLRPGPSGTNVNNLVFLFGF
jgi:hydroxypyruvate reductase